jgi:hypothetical protein
MRGSRRRFRENIADRRVLFHPGYSAAGRRDNEGAAPANVMPPVLQLQAARYGHFGVLGGLSCLRLPKPRVGYGVVGENAEKSIARYKICAQ